MSLMVAKAGYAVTVPDGEERADPRALKDLGF
jgi:hypothetical protein